VVIQVAPEATKVDKQLRHVEELLQVAQLLFNVLHAIEGCLKQKYSLNFTCANPVVVISP